MTPFPVVGEEKDGGGRRDGEQKWREWRKRRGREPKGAVYIFSKGLVYCLSRGDKGVPSLSLPPGGGDPELSQFVQHPINVWQHT